MKVNKILDFLERVAWTFVQAFLGYMIAADLTGSVKWSTVAYGALIAGGIAAAKVVVAQNIGSSGLGDAVPGGSVIESGKK